MSKAKGAAQLKFGRYNALTKLGQGAMATVYLAEDPALNRMVAIKVIHSHLSSNASLLDRFTVEAKTAASLRNPNIVEIFDYGLEDDAQYLVMEYIDGPNLQFVLNLLGGQPMAPEVCAAVICQAADGLITAEKFGVVHRDIKPENMMFKSEGALKIADFGIAHISEQNMTQTGSILGSPNFMSPEQVEGKKPSHLTDMFSLGAVFYYCLAGRKPFSGPNIPTIMRHICDMPHEPVTTFAPDADPFLVGLVDTLLQKDPADRGKGARWLSLQLRTWLTGKGIMDLSEVTRGFLETTGKLAGNQTVVDLTPAPAPDEPKTPLRPGMKVERKVAANAKPGTGIRPGTGTGFRSGAASGVRQGTWQGAPPGSNFDYDGTRPGDAKKNLLMWIGAGVIAVAILAAAGAVVFGGGAKEPAVQQAKKPVEVSAVFLQPGGMELQAGQKRRFIAEIQPPEAPAGVRWESSDPGVASVQDGEVTGLRPGTVNIRAVSLQNPARQGVAEVIVAAAETEAPQLQPVPQPQPQPERPRPQPQPERPRPQQARPQQPVAAQDGDDDAAANAFVSGQPQAAQPEKPAPAKAILTIITAPPFAEIIVDGRFMGTSPVKDKELPPGRHKVTIQHRQFPAIDTVLNLGPGPREFRFRFLK